jgi:hypothetical protein
VTDAKTDAMPAGRELDRLVNTVALNNQTWCPDDSKDELCRCSRGPENSIHFGEPLPEFSEDIQAAMWLWSQLKRPDDDLAVPQDAVFFKSIVEHDGYFVAGWLLIVGDVTRWHGPTMGIGTTVELAICRCAYKRGLND